MNLKIKYNLRGKLMGYLNQVWYPYFFYKVFYYTFIIILQEPPAMGSRGPPCKTIAPVRSKGGGIA